MKRFFFLPLAILLYVLTANGAEANAPLELFVSPLGNDAWTGRLAAPDPKGNDGPFATLDAARDALRTLKNTGKLRSSGAVISVRQGVYVRKTPFMLDERDSGTPGSPITYRAYPGEEPVLSGGAALNGFRPVTENAVLERLDEQARSHVVWTDVPAAALAVDLDTGQGGRPQQHELFFDGEPMRLAEWPNEDWTHIAAIPDGEQIIDASGKKRGLRTDRIQYAGARPSGWKSTKDIWVHGYWMYDWSDGYLRVKEIQPDTKTLVLEHPERSIFGYRTGQRFRFLNVLEELDSPGEWYLDRATSRLYFWPPSSLEAHSAVLSLLQESLVMTLDTSDIQLTGFVFECGNSHGVTIKSGNRVHIAGCTMRNLGGAGVLISGGSQHAVQSCDLFNLGERGIGLAGGDLQTLAEAGHVAGNNNIHHFARLNRTYCPGISMSGVGNTVRNNYIHDGPHAGILLGGNNHLIEKNELARLCLETADVGAFYMGRNWEERGNIVRYNYFHHLGGLEGNSNAVYLDDLASGVEVFGNVFYKVQRGIMLGGGRDNRIENNVFADTRIAIHLDARGLGWSRPLIESRKGGWDMYGRLESVPYDRPPYATQYPALANILDDEPLAPKRNVIARNIQVGPCWVDMRPISKDRDFDQAWVTFENNFTTGDPGFLDMEKADFHLRQDSPVWALGFQEIPLESIGLQEDEFRASLPPALK